MNLMENTLMITNNYEIYGVRSPIAHAEGYEIWGQIYFYSMGF